MISSYFNEVKNHTEYWLAASQLFKVLGKNGELDPVDSRMIERKIELLNPEHPNYPKLFFHQQAKFVKDIDSFFEKTKPKQPSVFVDPLTQGIQDIEKLKEKSSQSALHFHKELKKVHPDLRKKIYDFVWLIFRCPKEHSFSEYLLKKDLSVFGRVFSLFKGCMERSILEQVKEEFEIDFSLKENYRVNDDYRKILVETSLKEQINQAWLLLPNQLQSVVLNKVQLFKRSLEDRTTLTHTQMKGLFHFIPIAAQHQLALEGIQPPFYGRGFNPKLHETLGAHFNSESGRTQFSVYAPHATEVILNLTAFKNLEHELPMFKCEGGVWKVETDKAPPGRSYHFMIMGKNSVKPVKKVDPFAFQSIIHNLDSKRNDHESLVVDIKKEFPWTDQEWVLSLKRRNFSKEPLIIYEVHAPSWILSSNGKPPNWRELALKLADYCKMQGYNAVELMASIAHPHPISMGYQITNFFAPHIEMGNPEDLQYFVNYMHEKSILVFIDWVPAHFALDTYALSLFDGTALFEEDDPHYAMHPHWGTKVFDYKKQWTKDFLASNLCFLLKNYHFDGVRVDAMSSILYLNYGRPEHERRFNRKGSEINFAARSFFRNLNAYLSKEFPGVVRMVEESSGFPNLTRSVFQKGVHESKHEKKKTRGIGFDMTWHMGFMHHTIASVQRDIPDFESFVHTVTNVDDNVDVRPRGQVILPFSHDENANGKGTLLTKMPGMTEGEKFARFRFITAYQLLRGGGGVLEFSGNQKEEWHYILIKNGNDPKNAKPTFDWKALEDPLHNGAQKSCRDLHHLWLQNRGLWDQTDKGFSWIYTDSKDCTLGFHRRSYSEEGHIEQQFACIFNTSKKFLEDYLIPLPKYPSAPELDLLSSVKEVYNSDNKQYGGEGRVNGHVEIIYGENNRPTHFKLQLAPSGVLVLEEKFL